LINVNSAGHKLTVVVAAIPGNAIIAR
jgi:hypothetical protein